MAAALACGLAAQAQVFEATATLNQVTGSSSSLPVGLVAGSVVDVTLNLGGNYVYQQLNAADSIITFSGATFSYSGVNGTDSSSQTIGGVTVFFADNYLGFGETVFEAQASDASGTFAIGFSSPDGPATNNTEGSLMNYLAGVSGSSFINSSLQLEFSNAFGPSGVGSDPLGSFGPRASVPDTFSTGIFGLAALALAVGAWVRQKKVPACPR
jgi:hypothetical protein